MAGHTTRRLLSGLTAGCALFAVACQGQHEKAPPSAPAASPVREPKAAAVVPTAPAPERGGAAERRKAYLEGCEEGDGQACFALGEMVEEGVGGPQEPRRARALYEQACAFGSEEACDALGH